MQQKRRDPEAVLQRSDEVQALDPRYIYIRTRFAVHLHCLMWATMILFRWREVLARGMNSLPAPGFNSPGSIPTYRP